MREDVVEVSKVIETVAEFVAVVVGSLYYIFRLINLDEELFQLIQDENDTGTPPQGAPKQGTEEFSVMVKE